MRQYPSLKIALIPVEENQDGRESGDLKPSLHNLSTCMRLELCHVADSLVMSLFSLGSRKASVRGALCQDLNENLNDILKISRHLQLLQYLIPTHVVNLLT
jgi:hypothetical protein